MQLLNQITPCSVAVDSSFFSPPPVLYFVHQRKQTVWMRDRQTLMLWAEEGLNSLDCVS